MRVSPAHDARSSLFPGRHHDLERGDDVVVILSLHGAGSYGNWQRHYFPLLDYVDKYDFSFIFETGEYAISSLPAASERAQKYSCSSERTRRVRIGKGHTEGLEPKITEELVKMKLSARGGKIQRGGKT